MKIVIITEYFPDSPSANITGGVEARCYNAAKRLARSHDVTVLCSYQKGQERIQHFDSITVYRCGLNNPYSHKGNILNRLNFVIAALFRGMIIKADLLEGFSFLGYVPAGLLGFVKGVPKIATYHETWAGQSWVKNKGLLTGGLGSIWERVALKLGWNRIIAVSEFTKKQLEIQGVKPEKITVIPNGVDIEKYEQFKVSKYNLPTVCCVARLVKTKKVDTLIHAIALIKKEIPDIQCRIIGDGEEKENLKELIKQLKLEKNFTLLGFVEKNEDVIKEIKKSHIFCLPSAVEGFGMVVIEAMACGVPYVCSDIPPLIEVTGNGVGGQIFKLDDYKDLADKITNLFKDKNEYTEKIKLSEQFVKKYDWDQIVSKLNNMYDLII